MRVLQKKLRFIEDPRPACYSLFCFSENEEIFFEAVPLIINQ